ncbi:MAG: peptidase S10 [Planctomycetota bacterium]|nr:peptidase S10 [Planctomycetota bacterium]
MRKVVTHHGVTINGQRIRYTATAGTITLTDEDGTERGDMFFIAYEKEDTQDFATRPITFSFNGGPGSSSVWLHLGTLGPRRVLMGDVGNLLPPPWKLGENAHSILDATDLVFIDPIMTGYSRPKPGEDKSQFHGYNEDVESVGEFIRLWVTKHKRWESPKFLIGESYGTTRAAGLAGYLASRYDMFLNGIMLVSSVLNFQTLRFSRGNDLPYLMYLPTYTATAWYHGKLDPDLQRDLQQTLKAVEQFTLNEYSVALMKGDALEDSERTRIVQQLARFTGLSETFIEQSNLRLGQSRFCKELLRDEGNTAGRLDSRFRGLDFDDAGDRYDFDPSMAAISGPYSATLNHYLRADLKFEDDRVYEILGGRVRPWNYDNVQNEYLNVAETLREAMTENPFLKVFVANGYYDLATPYFATTYTFNHMNLDSTLRDHVSMAYYEAGHMMYIHEPSLAQLKIDLTEFIHNASNID